MARPESPEATIYAVAQHAGVSTATVSRVLSGSPKVTERTRGAVMQAARDLQYVPKAAARALAGRRTSALGLVLPHIDGPYYADLLVGFEVAASELGRSVVIFQAAPRTDVSRALQSLAGQVDGIAFMARSSVTEEQITELSRVRPAVTVARPAQPDLPALFAENRGEAHRLTQHLIESGRRRLAFVGRPERGSDIGQRHRGHLAALEESGLQPAALLEVDPVEAEGAAAADRLLEDHPDVDAIVCGNDQLALAAGKRLHERGRRIGQDIAVTGWDDTLAARYVRPGLTSVRQPVRELGAQAARTLISLVEGLDADPTPVVLGSQIIHRGSCCPDPSPLLDPFTTTEESS